MYLWQDKKVNYENTSPGKECRGAIKYKISTDMNYIYLFIKKIIIYYTKKKKLNPIPQFGPDI